MPRPPLPDCYDYVRRYYGVPAYIGVRVKVMRAEERLGVLVDVKSGDQYVHVRLDGETRRDPYHPTDVTYVVNVSSMLQATRDVDGMTVVRS